MCIWTAFWQKWYHDEPQCSQREKEQFQSFHQELQAQWTLFCESKEARDKNLIGTSQYISTFSSDISGSQPIDQLVAPKVAGIVELKMEPYCMNVFGLVPKRGDLFVGFVLDDKYASGDTVKIHYGDGLRNVRMMTLQKGRPALIFENSVMVSRHTYLEVRVYPHEAMDFVYFIYAFVGNEYKKWFSNATFACPVTHGKLAIYPKQTKDSFMDIRLEKPPYFRHELKLTTPPSTEEI